MIKLKDFGKIVKPSKPTKRDLIMIGVGSLITMMTIYLFNVAQNDPLPLQPQTSKVNIPWLPETVKRWEDPINEMANKYNIDPNLVAIIMTLESGGYSKATSQVGAQGLMQVMPATGKDIAAKHLKKSTTNYDLMDPHTNIEFGTAYLAYLRNEFGLSDQGPSWNSTVELIAAGYNGGPGAANRLFKGEGLRSTETVVYSRDAYNMWRERRAKASPTFERWVERGGSVLIEKAKTEKI